MNEPRVVAFGGGHGLATSLAALRTLTPHLTAVVTVADDGGSSGRLRTELGALAPGDLRMALTALAAPGGDAQSWAELFQHRFGGSGPLAGHAVGNLVLAGLAETAGSPVAALDLCLRLLGGQGRVLPLSPVSLDIIAEVAGLADDAREVREIRGQHEVATTPGRVCGVALEPAEPPATPEALAAVHEADWVILGPGSWFTSVIPHLLVPELREAVLKTAARRLLVLNLTPQPGETSGFSPEAHLEALHAHVPDLELDLVLADESVLDQDGLMDAARLFGAEVRYARVASDEHSARHDPSRLADAYRSILEE